MILMAIFSFNVFKNISRQNCWVRAKPNALAQRKKWEWEQHHTNMRGFGMMSNCKTSTTCWNVTYVYVFNLKCGNQLNCGQKFNNNNNEKKHFEWSNLNIALQCNFLSNSNVWLCVWMVFRRWLLLKWNKENGATQNTLYQLRNETIGFNAFHEVTWWNACIRLHESQSG